MKAAALLMVASMLVACSGHDPQGAVSAVARALYDDDPGAVSAHFDDTLRPKLTRAGVGLISDKMHALGNYDGLTLLAINGTKHEYTYRASFSKGTMNVVVRVDPDGRFAAYRLFPT